MSPNIEYHTDDLIDADAERGKSDNSAPPKQSVTPVQDVVALSLHDDPFAPREGKTLTWKNVNMTLVRVR
jgi:hypothetical protein